MIRYLQSNGITVYCAATTGTPRVFFLAARRCNRARPQSAASLEATAVGKVEEENNYMSDFKNVCLGFPTK